MARRRYASDLDTAPWRALKCLHHLTSSGGKNEKETLGSARSEACRPKPLSSAGFIAHFELIARSSRFGLNE
jgi:hypothetical protein